jgi:disulfide bond formation protein DsbB
MRSREIGNIAYHFFGAIALVGAVYISHWFLVLNTFIWASLREQAQHRYILEDLGHFDGYESRLYAVHKRTFFNFGWLGKKQAWEITQWTLGAIVACLIWEIRR